jgi:hypothetical protein
MWEVFLHHGFPNNIISDCGPQFISHFSKHLCDRLRITYKLSSAYHPEIDGQTKRTNQTLEQYLRCLISYQEDDWSHLFHLAEFAYNNTLHSSTKVTPFYTYTGNHPQWCLLDIPMLSPNPSAEQHLHCLQQLSPSCLHIFRRLRLHSRLVIRYGCYGATSRLLGHVIS